MGKVDISVSVLACSKCGRPLSKQTVVEYNARRHSGLCRSCSMLGKRNRLGKFKKIK